LIVRSKAPLRLGLAGGGTDVSPYCDNFGGCVLNASINLYAHVSIELLNSGSDCTFIAQDIEQIETVEFNETTTIEGPLKLHRAVYKKVIEQYRECNFVPVKVITYADAPPGSGLGSSSTMIVAMLEAYKHMFSLPLGEYDIARLAYEIERIDCGLSGGKQDQYAATFGGFNFMEFSAENRVVVNPLRIKRHIINELEASMLLFYTGQSRNSAKIIDDQKKSVLASDGVSLEAMHELKSSAFRTKEMLLKGDVLGVALELNTAWGAKKNTSVSISNKRISIIEEAVLEAGAISLKISGAGGGGFMMIFSKPEQKLTITKTLSKFSGQLHRFQFTEHGSMTWNN
jgi:D-glycero-alpha-D-manno-heptose-7-phosphate kinase